jgi:hypothetical protein
MTYLAGRKTFAIVALAFIVLQWPICSHARGGGSQSGSHKDITITKTTDKSSVKMTNAKKSNSSLLRGNNSNNQKGGRYLAQ